ncbi:RidA family protein [Jinshanibacter sp. LJY008]|uniref:RidA family protein n=1 Tax=Limnobaculum eriocheiris TaxID=2897391 RepID=A0A9X1MVJ7_9GAMM|nr:RidA family protein [Limnobaculum eriocheiris]MCD1125395.1 RidA family protein [Limnobaculum eriocheiris]
MNLADTENRIAHVNSPELSKPGGHYSHACICNGMVYLSGQLPVDAQGQALANRPFEQQVRQVLFNIEASLNASGSSKSKLVQVRIFIVDMEMWPEFNRIYAEWIGGHRPARIVAGVSCLHFGSALEIEAIAQA